MYTALLQILLPILSQHRLARDENTEAHFVLTTTTTTTTTATTASTTTATTTTTDFQSVPSRLYSKRFTKA